MEKIQALWYLTPSGLMTRTWVMMNGQGMYGPPEEVLPTTLNRPKFLNKSLHKPPFNFGPTQFA